jgi:hypothetical protein
MLPSVFLRTFTKQPAWNSWIEGHVGFLQIGYIIHPASLPVRSGDNSSMTPPHRIDTAHDQMPVSLVPTSWLLVMNSFSEFVIHLFCLSGLVPFLGALDPCGHFHANLSPYLAFIAFLGSHDAMKFLHVTSASNPTNYCFCPIPTAHAGIMSAYRDY